MTKNAIILCLLVLVSSTSMAQLAQPEGEAAKKLTHTYTPYQFKPGQVQFVGFRNPPSEDLSWQPSMTKISPNESEDDPKLEKIKEIKDRQKSRDQATVTAAKTTAILPVVGTNFAGIFNGGGQSPLDNTVAISNAGKIVAFVNSKVTYYSSTGTATYTAGLWALINDPTLTNDMCDPKVIYDNAADRFIFFAQVCDAISAHSKIVVGFSKTNDPAAGWYIYELTGNPLNDGSWFDYPKMAVSGDEVFVTGNLFFEGAGFNQSVIYQIDKTACYAGGTMSSQYWAGIAGSFTILPVSLGESGSYGPGIYCVNTTGSSFGSGNIQLHVINNNIASGTATLSTYNVSTSSYSIAGNASQKGSTVPLNTGDSRALDGFFLNGVIHFVFNSDAGGGWCGINYNRLTVATATNVSSVYGTSGTSDVCYPAISSISTTATDASVMIAFNECSPSLYPRTCAIMCDNSMTWSSPTVVKSGASYVHYPWSTAATDRWGDYTGMCKKYNASTGTAWMAGMYGSTSHTWYQWIAELKVGTGPGVGIVTATNTDESIKVFPNPVYDNYSIAFTLKEREDITVSIVDINGRAVKELYATTAEAGEQIFSFNKSNLSPCIYFIHISSKSTILKNEKIIISGN